MMHSNRESKKIPNRDLLFHYGVTLKAQISAISRLEKSMKARGIDIGNEIEAEWIDNFSRAINFPSSSPSSSTDTSSVLFSFATYHSNNEIFGRKSSRIQFTGNQELTSRRHNRYCDICNLSDKLFFCQSCSLSFHIDCLKPKLNASSIHSIGHGGHWNCFYCIAEGSVPGDKKIAFRSIRNILVYHYDNEFNKIRSLNPSLDFNCMQDISIAKSNRQFVARKLVRGLSIELGRYNSVEEAINSLHKSPIPTEALSSIATGACCPIQLYSSPHIATTDTSSTCASSSLANEFIHCTCCMDDPFISTCAFCGCQKCFGRNDTDKLVTCDGCQVVTHSFCLDAPLPQGTPSKSTANNAALDQHYMCKTCTTQGKALSSLLATTSQVNASISVANRKESTVAVAVAEDNRQPRVSFSKNVELQPLKQDNHIGSSCKPSSSSSKSKVMKKGRGRPPGSSKLKENNSMLSSLGTSTYNHRSSSSSSTSSASNKSPRHSSNANDDNDDEEYFNGDNDISTSVNANEGGGGEYYYQDDIDDNDGCADDIEDNNHHTQMQVVQEQEVQIRYAPGIESALKISQIMSQRSLKVNERIALDEFKFWAPIFDLQTAMDSMMQQRKLLLKRILAKDPKFVFDNSEFENAEIDLFVENDSKRNVQDIEEILDPVDVDVDIDIDIDDESIPVDHVNKKQRLALEISADIDTSIISGDENKELEIITSSSPAVIPDNLSIVAYEIKDEEQTHEEDGHTLDVLTEGCVVDIVNPTNCVPESQSVPLVTLALLDVAMLSEEI